MTTEHPPGQAAQRRRIVAALASVYRLGIYPWLWALAGGGPHAGCRHEPSCSRYAEMAIGRDGWWRGGRQALRRVLSCHPFGTEKPSTEFISHELRRT